MEVFQVALVLATFLCSLVAGFLFAFAIVVMPGIRCLKDNEFIRAFQAIDRVIQNNQRAFMLVWVGSAVALITSATLGIRQLDGVGLVLIILAMAIYLLGVQLPTFTINIPLNNKLEAVDVNSMNEMSQKDFREEFERRFPDAEVHKFENAGHYVLEDAGDEIAALLRAFVDRTESPTG